MSGYRSKGTPKRPMQRLLGVVAALVFVSALGPVASAAITNRVTVQPIQVQNSAGEKANAGMELFEPETDKIWAQAGIDIDFLDWNTIVNDDLYVLDDHDGEDGILDEIADRDSPGASSDSSVLNMWFVDEIDDNDDNTLIFGLAFQPGTTIAIADAVFGQGTGGERLDTIAHEIGHNLGLPHTSPEEGETSPPSDNLMTTGSERTVPDSIDDIYPDGLQLDRLTSDQISTVMESDLVQAIPEPGTGLLLVGASAVGLVRGRRRAQA